MTLQGIRPACNVDPQLTVRALRPLATTAFHAMSIGPVLFIAPGGVRRTASRYAANTATDRKSTMVAIPA
jgi:hypothetical protein